MLDLILAGGFNDTSWPRLVLVAALIISGIAIIVAVFGGYVAGAVLLIRHLWKRRQ